MESKSPAVTCGSCQRAWNSISMAEGLRLLGQCPRCGGALNFADDATGGVPRDLVARDGDTVAPHLVLGIPRR